MNNTRMPGSHRNMLKIPEWTYDEMKQTGVDYASVEQVQRYDDMHQRFRDYEKDSDAIIKLLELDPKQRSHRHGRRNRSICTPCCETLPKSIRSGRIFRHAEPLPEKRRREGDFKRSVLPRRILDVQARGRASGRDGLDSGIASPAGFLEISRSYEGSRDVKGRRSVLSV